MNKISPKLIKIPLIFSEKHLLCNFAENSTNRRNFAGSAKLVGPICKFVDFVEHFFAKKRFREISAHACSVT